MKTIRQIAYLLHIQYAGKGTVIVDCRPNFFLPSISEEHVPNVKWTVENLTQSMHAYVAPLLIRAKAQNNLQEFLYLQKILNKKHVDTVRLVSRLEPWGLWFRISDLKDILEWDLFAQTGEVKVKEKFLRAYTKDKKKFEAKHATQ